MTLQDHVHQLTRPHLTRRPDGKYVEQAALLDQLAEAVKPSGASRSGGGKGGHIPINTDAIELWKQLDTKARREELDRSGITRGHLGGILARWADEKRAEWVGHLEHVTLDIIDQIDRMLNPPVPRRSLNQPCPACGTTWILNEDGERTSALTARDRDPATGGVLTEDEMDINCAHCEAGWANTEGDYRLTWILQVLANQRVAELRHAS